MKLYRAARAALLVILLLYSKVALAKDLGKYGASFEIKEEGFLRMIQRKLKSIDIAAEQERLQKIAKDRAAEPKKVEGMKKTQEARSYIYDPTYIVREDIYLPGGKLLHKAGETVNPLEHMTIEHKLFFINSNDEEQINWLIRQSLGAEDKVILVEGRPFELEAKLLRPVYFDQFGEVTNKFGIKHVPAKAYQEGKVIRIEEQVVN